MTNKMWKTAYVTGAVVLLVLCVSLMVSPAKTDTPQHKTVEEYFKAGNPNPLTYRAGEALYSRDVSSKLRQFVIDRDKCCVVCGTTDSLEVDHWIALMNGGGNEESNLNVLCDSCHKEKTRYDWSIKRRRRKMLHE